MSAWQRFLRFREAEFIDNVQKNNFSNAWPTFAEFLGRAVPHPDDPDQKPNGVVLTRYWYMIPPPNPTNISQFPEIPDLDSSFIFFAKDLQP